MKASGQARVVVITCANTSEARRIARAVVEKRLAACVNILRSPIQSIYRWKGKLERAREVMILVKTTAKRLPALEMEVKCLHSYDVPEFVVLPIVAGSQEYLSWLAECVR